MYDFRPNLVIGFHGCDEDICYGLLNNPNEVKISQEPFDWLGHGMYFWENNYNRALKWAIQKQKRGKIIKPSVIGAVLQLGYCCDFLDSKYIQLLRSYYNLMADSYKKSGKLLPKNKDLAFDQHKDKILRELDCAVIEFMNRQIFNEVQMDLVEKGFSEYHFFDSVRGVFMEGGPAFEGAGILEKSHIQICIRNLNCIKGFFIPRKEINYSEWIESRQRA